MVQMEREVGCAEVACAEVACEVACAVACGEVACVEVACVEVAVCQEKAYEKVDDLVLACKHVCHATGVLHAFPH